MKGKLHLLHGLNLSNISLTEKDFIDTNLSNNIMFEKKGNLCNENVLHHIVNWYGVEKNVGVSCNFLKIFQIRKRIFFYKKIYATEKANKN